MRLRGEGSEGNQNCGFVIRECQHTIREVDLPELRQDHRTVNKHPKVDARRRKFGSIGAKRGEKKTKKVLTSPMDSDKK